MGNKWSATPSVTSEINIEEDEPPDEAGVEKLSLTLLETKNLSLSNLDNKNGKIHTLIRVKSSFNAQIYTKPVKFSPKDETCPWLLPNTKFVFAGNPNGEIVVSLVSSNLPPLPAIPSCSSNHHNCATAEKKCDKAVCIAKLIIPVSVDEFKENKVIRKWIKVQNLSGETTEVPEVFVGLKYSPKQASLVLKAGENITDRYDVDNVLGTGQNIVKKAKSKVSKKEYAIKFISKEQKGQKVPKQTIDREIELLKSLSHDNIVQLCESLESNDTVYVVMELVEGVDLFDVTQTLGSLRPSLAGYLVGQLMSAVAYLHSLGIAHHDIKPENILVDYAANKVKLTDFGSAKEVKKMSGVGGTLNFMAPEILNRMRGVNQHCDQSVDIWGVGIVAYILLSGNHPFDYPSKNNSNIINRILSGKFEFPSPHWDSIPKQCKDFIQKCLVLDPKKRASAQELLKHPWIVSSSAPVSAKVASFTQKEKEKLEIQRTSRNNSRSSSMQSLLELFGNNNNVPSRA